MQRAQILDVIAACDDPNAGLAADDSVLDARFGCQIRIAVAAVRAEHDTARHQGLHCALQRRVLAVRKALEETRARPGQLR